MLPLLIRKLLVYVFDLRRRCGTCPPWIREGLSPDVVSYCAAANLRGRPAVFVLGFTHASQSQTKAWSARLAPTIPTYSVAVLQDVPRLVRGMAVAGIKSGVPQSERDRFILVFKGEKELKDASGFSPNQPNDAYILLADSAGAIQWQFHGPVTDAAIAELRSKLPAQ